LPDGAHARDGGSLPQGSAGLEARARLVLGSLLGLGLETSLLGEALLLLLVGVDLGRLVERLLRGLLGLQRLELREFLRPRRQRE